MVVPGRPLREPLSEISAPPCELLCPAVVTKPLAIFLVPGLRPADPLSFSAVLLALGISLRHDGTSGANTKLASDVSTKVTATPSEGIEVAENQSNDTENATAFVSLPYATDPETLEGGAVVRVLLSRSALASLGLPVANMEATEQIPADIVLSEDGAPQAIRLVSQAQVDYSVTASLGGTNESQR